MRRRTAVVSIERRSGTTTIVSGLAVISARLRSDRLLIIAADDPERSQFAWLTSPYTVRHLTPEHRNDLLLFRGEVISNAQCDHNLTITDWGAAPSPQLSLIATGSRALRPVTATNRGMIQSALDVAMVLGKYLPVLLVVAGMCGVVGSPIRVSVRGLPPTSVLQRHDHCPGTRKKLREPGAFEVYRPVADLVEVFTRPAKERIP